MPRYEVRADLAEVEATLREALTPQELATLAHRGGAEGCEQSFSAPGARRGEPVSTRRCWCGSLAPQPVASPTTSMRGTHDQGPRTAARQVRRPSKVRRMSPPTSWLFPRHALPGEDAAIFPTQASPWCQRRAGASRFRQPGEKAASPFSADFLEYAALVGHEHPLDPGQCLRLPDDSWHGSTRRARRSAEQFIGLFTSEQVELLTSRRVCRARSCQLAPSHRIPEAKRVPGRSVLLQRHWWSLACCAMS